MKFRHYLNSKITRIITCAATFCLFLLCNSSAQNLIVNNNTATRAHINKKTVARPGTVDTAASAGTYDTECRDPRPDESAVINKAREVIDKSIGGALKQMGWQSSHSDRFKLSIATHPNPYRPMFICSRAFDLTISPDPNSAYGKKLNDSIRFYQAQTSQAAIVRSVVLGEMQNIKIRITENDPYLKSKYDHDATDKYTVLQVPGVSYAYRLAEPEQGAGADIPPDYKTFILIGNWTGANMNFNNYVMYPFIHKTGGAYIETLTIQIVGPASVADKIIHNVDWRGLSAALTK
ncbi:MAG TPA: hypothetical protein VFE53_09510 [Mucilaginibacter sp.]|jgi:hypothetical protein|nr:hypothetical protein [Mucilaginibacter sp.]